MATSGKIAYISAPYGIDIEPIRSALRSAGVESSAQMNWPREVFLRTSSKEVLNEPISSWQ